MNKLYTLLALVPLFLLCERSYAAADLVIVPTTYFVTEAITSPRSVSFRVDNRGDQLSRRFRLKLWASKDNLFTENEVIDSSRVNVRGSGIDAEGNIVNLSVGDDGFFSAMETTVIVNNVRRWAAYYSYSYSLPLADDLTPMGNPRPLSDLLGDEYHFQACLIYAGETECDPEPLSTRDDQTTFVPARVQDIKLIGDNVDRMELTWAEVPFDNYTDDAGNSQSVDFVSYYRIERLDENNATTVTELAPSALEKIMVDEQERFILRFDEMSGLNRGKRNSFTVESCHDTGIAVPPIPGCYPRTARRSNSGFFRDAAALEKVFTASQDIDTGVMVSWEEPTAGVRRYKLKRCTQSDSPVCINIELEGSNTSYLDIDTLRGVVYNYTISACDLLFQNSDPNDLRNGKCREDDIYVYPFGVARSGMRGLVDRYEEDDNVSQATVVNSSVSQLHSFDSTLDEDWVRIDLGGSSRLNISTSSFNNENVDTVLSLYDEELNLLIENIDADPENNVASFSLIESEPLPASSYYLKAAHYRLPIDGFTGKEANNYLLNIEILDKKFNLMPILMLLTGDD